MGCGSSLQSPQVVIIENLGAATYTQLEVEAVILSRRCENGHPITKLTQPLASEYNSRNNGRDFELILEILSLSVTLDDPREEIRAIFRLCESLIDIERRIASYPEVNQLFYSTRYPFSGVVRRVGDELHLYLIGETEAIFALASRSFGDSDSITEERISALRTAVSLQEERGRRVLAVADGRLPPYSVTVDTSLVHLTNSQAFPPKTLRIAGLVSVGHRVREDLAAAVALCRSKDAIVSIVGTDNPIFTKECGYESGVYTRGIPTFEWDGNETAETQSDLPNNLFLRIPPTKTSECDATSPASRTSMSPKKKTKNNQMSLLVDKLMTHTRTHAGVCLCLSNQEKLEFFKQIKSRGHSVAYATSEFVPLSKETASAADVVLWVPNERIGGISKLFADAFFSSQAKKKISQKKKKNTLKNT
eukprot:GHVR01188286.1.p1 GENE.GHVR01188286.1~~GHVR01188286.1.p1  ORF type:complete len:420 (+),score=64.04 GHVR01188286.1:46-1305(+)